MTSSPSQFSAPTLTKFKLPRLEKDKLIGSLKQWRNEKPISNQDRRDLLKKCKDACYLIPDKLSYPICKTAPTIDCKISCSGLRAATARARLVLNNPNVKKEAKTDANRAYEEAVNLGRQHCDWE